MKCCTSILTVSIILFPIGNAQGLVKMEFIEMLVHTFIEKGHMYNRPFQNEISNGSFTLECDRNLCLKAFLWFIGFFFPPPLRALCSPCLCSPGLLTDYCLHLQVIRKQSNAVVIHL